MEERLKKSIAGTVKATKDATKKVVKKISNNPKSSKYVMPHRHCTICYTPIPLDADPPNCGATKCAEKHARQQKSRKRLNIMLYLFPAIAIMLFILPIVIK
jgi:predicted nucleic acid-binding Zn ribbon protein